jgi:hypothetical protein
MFHWHDDRLRQPLDLDHGECFFLTACIRHVDDFSLQLIFAMKFHEDLHGLGDVSIADSKIDPAVSHIF